MKLKPAPGYAHIKKEESTSQGGGVMITREKPDVKLRGKVLAVGDAYLNDGQKIEPHFKVDDLVVYYASDYDTYILENGDAIEVVKFNSIVSIYEN